MRNSRLDMMISVAAVWIDFDRKLVQRGGACFTGGNVR